MPVLSDLPLVRERCVVVINLFLVRALFFPTSTFAQGEMWLWASSFIAAGSDERELPYQATQPVPSVYRERHMFFPELYIFLAPPQKADSPNSIS